MSDTSGTDIWTQALAYLTGRLTKEEIGRWLKPLCLEYAPIHQAPTLTAPNRFFVQWVSDHYLDQINEALSLILGQPVLTKLVSPAQGPEAAWQPAAAPALPRQSLPRPEPPRPGDTGLNGRYCFDNFVVGPSNQFAHAAARAVANLPGTTYNPLFIYGGAGLGKTHLLNAVGNQMLGRNLTAKVAYVTCEDFTNQMIQAIRNKSMDAFRAKYRYMDALLIDDIHFLGTKESTQEEFFFTFNALYEAGHQIILSSDQRPKEIPGLEERLRSRFEWGLIADIQTPERETKVAIIQKKAEEEGISVPEEVAFFLSGTEEANIRVLEGYLVRLAAYSSLHGRSISLAMAKEALSDALAPKEITIDKIIRIVALNYNVRLVDLRSSRKEKKITEPRQIAMYLARTMTKQPLVNIGQKFGGKDHSTVVHAVKKITGRLTKDPEFRQEVKQLEQAIRRGH